MYISIALLIFTKIRNYSESTESGHVNTNLFWLQEEEDSVSLFDRQLLKEVDLRKGECKLHNCGLAVNNPGDNNLVLRPLCSDDYEKGK